MISGVPDSVTGLIEMVSDDSEKRSEAAARLRRIHELMNTSKRGFDYFDGLFPALKMQGMPFHEVVDKYNACMNGFGELNKWLDFVETKKECDENGLEDFTDKIVRRNNGVRDVRKAFERGFYMQWLSLAIDDVPSVQTFRRRVHEQRLGKFVKLDEKQFDISKERIRDRIISTFPSRNGVTRARSELGILQHEMEKKRKIMPLRKLFHEIPTLLLTLKPCLMMSPLSVAYFLNEMGVLFRPDSESKHLYLYPEELKKIAAEKESSWEYLLFIGAGMCNYKWLQKYRVQKMTLWQNDDEDDERIESRSELVEFLHEQMEKLQEFVNDFGACMNDSIKPSFGEPGESGDEYEIIDATEIFFGIYKSVIA